MHKKVIARSISLIIVLTLMCAVSAVAQCPSDIAVYRKILALENNVIKANWDTAVLNTAIVKLNSLKKQFEACKLTKDSVYARLLHRIAAYEYQINNSIATVNSISYTLEAAHINTASSKGACKKFAVDSYINLGYYYRSLGLYDKAINYFDSVIVLNEAYAGQSSTTLEAIRGKIDAYFSNGDYQKDAEACSFYINAAKSSIDNGNIPYYYNQRAQALIYQNSVLHVPQDIDSAMRYAILLKNDYELITSYKLKAVLAVKNFAYAKADSFLAIVVKKRQATNENDQIGRDYLDYGNFYLDYLGNYDKAKVNYIKAIYYASKANNNIVLAKAYVNIGQANFRLQHLREAEQHYSKAFALLNITAPDDFLKNAPAARLSLVSDKDLLIVLLNNKTELLLHLYKVKKDNRYLQATLQTALLTDSVITQLRHEHIGEQSKLYWRNKTREFFTNALEACYLDSSAGNAFYFMEKSRAVLLGDKLNELGALAYIPPAAATQEEHLQLQIVEEQQRLLLLPASSVAYNKLQFQNLNHKQQLEHFIQSLEQKYPAYYQYKYADNILTLDSLKQHLTKKHQSLVHYFMNDTVMYILGISQNNTKFLKLSQKDFDTKQLAAFLELCSDKEKLKSKFEVFAFLAQNIYNQLFKPLQLPKGDVAICTDNFLIPFEALCTDKEGKNFLLNNYSFSYVYSARTFIKPFVGNDTAVGNFIGFAPVTFAPRLQLVSLNQSAEALSQSADFYNKSNLFTNNKATRGNFFNNASKYKMIAIFSHAQADTSGVEPVLYLQDSAIQLSELQLLQKPAAQLVLLSACQTNIGKAATGEGIYSLARGFAVAGIPAVAGTLWKADDQTVYRISSKFNEYLAGGMSKSEALQRAKRWFVNQYKDEHQLPYYWANMVLIGDTQPISLIKENYSWWWITGMIFTLIAVTAVVVLIIKNKKNPGRNDTGKSPHKKIIRI